MISPRFIIRATIGVCVTLFTAIAAEDLTEDQIDFFEKRIRPVLVNRCYNCHSADTKPSGGLRVDDRAGFFAGGDTGPAVVAGDPDKSLIIRRLKQKDSKRRMPQDDEALSESQIEDFVTWIQSGAAWPKTKLNYTRRINPEYEELKSKHWAWQPLKKSQVPSPQNAAWARSDIDQFVLAKLEEKRLLPVGDADQGTLLRRVTFDLTGLPPTPAELNAFLQDKSPDAFENVVDRLLASQAFGERWGRHWLDVARYAESTGPSRNVPYPHAWKYRDYVIDAVRRDIPFDRFIREQIAGDLLPAETDAERDRLLTATGFLALGAKDVNQRFKVRFNMDNVDEQIDTVSRSVMGLTVSCARCHDHKFDPVPMSDYYALAGIFTSTENRAGVRNKMGGGGLDYYVPEMLVLLATNNLPTPPQEKVDKLTLEVAAAKKEWDGIRGTPEGLKQDASGRPRQRAFRLKYETLQGELQSLTDPAALGYAVHGVRDAKSVADTELRLRGEAEKLGPVIPRGFLTTFAVPEVPAINPEQSGRLELASWLTSTNNPLTPRVVVNRAWQHLFGDGIVTTVDNFGINGDRPSHPELLDYLANEFIRNGWSTKKLVRTIVLSRAYQLGSERTETHHTIDPANRLIWRHSPRRLSAEEMRDAILTSSGQLIVQPLKGSAAKELRMVEMRDNGPEARTIQDASDTALYRSIYLPLLRGVVPKALEPFDPVEQSLVTGKRDATTVPTQSLFLLNSAFVRKQSLALAEQLSAIEGDDSKRIEQAYLRALNRRPSRSEADRAARFLAEFEQSSPEIASAVIQVAHLTEKRSPAKTEEDAAANPDDVPRGDDVPQEEPVLARDTRAAAWMSFVQALYASAEFRFVR